MIVLIGYFLTMIESAVITWLFYRASNGLLRKLLIMLFGCITWGLMARGVVLLTGESLIPLEAIILPLCFSFTLLCGHLIYKIYIKKDKTL